VIRRRKLRARSPRYPRRWPAVVLWSVAGLAMAAVPLWLAYLHGRKPPKGETPNPVLETFGQTVPATALSFLALIALAYCARRVSQEAMAYRPGRIEVPVFVVGPGVSADAAQLTLAFRRRLAELSLSAPTPVPGAGSDAGFFDVLGREKLDAGNVPGTLVSLLRAAKPPNAWQVNGVLVQRERAPRHGVALQVAQPPHRANPPQTVWAASHGEAVLRAADFATAAILPRTRMCQEPWAGWKRHVMPGELLAALEQGVRLESDRRYDEALDAYYRASAGDPMNMAMRLKIGQLQEKLGLYLDALITYEGIAEVDRSAGVRQRFRGRRAARSQWRRAVLAARYRRVVLLGGAELAEQWRRLAFDPVIRTARDLRRIELRRRMRDRLEQRLAKVDRRHRKWFASCGADPGRGRPNFMLLRRGRLDPKWLLHEDSLSARPPGGEPDADERHALFELRELLALAALEDLQRLSRRTSLGLRNYRLRLTRKTVRLTRACIEVRLAWIQDQLLCGGHGRDAVHLPFGVEAAGSRWPPRPERLQRRIRRIEGLRRFGRWHEHYNAACVFALPMMGNLSEEERGEFAARAVQRLARATACADSGYVAGRREWLVSEDPDLDGLRQHECFRVFEAMYFPTDRPTSPRPRHVRQLESARYVRDLLAETAKRWEEEWHRRGRALEKHPDVHTMIDWWKTELRAWRLVRQVAADYRHWPVRLELIEAMRDWASVYEFAPLEVSFHRYEEQPLRARTGALPASVGRHPTRGFERRMRAVHRCLPDRATRTQVRTLLRTLEQWQSTLRQLDIEGRAPDKLVLAKLCDGHAGLWQLLQQWLAEDASVSQQACQLAFVAQITRHDEAIATRAAALAANGRPPQRAGKRPQRGAAPAGSRRKVGRH
jgi:hypothetical protein